MPLVGQVGETNVASKLATDDVLHIARGLGDGLGVARADGLSISAERVAALDKRRFLAGAGGRGVTRQNGGAVRNRGSRSCITGSVFDLLRTQDKRRKALDCWVWRRIPLGGPLTHGESIDGLLRGRGGCKGQHRILAPRRESCKSANGILRPTESRLGSRSKPPERSWRTDRTGVAPKDTRLSQGAKDREDD